MSGKQLLGVPVVELSVRDMARGAKNVCFLHRDREATRKLNIPCAPGGSLLACDECATEAGLQAFFDHYKAGHAKHIQAFKQTNPNS